MSIKLDLIVEPQTSFAMAQRKDVQVGFVATNTGAAVTDPQLDQAELRVNGERSQTFSLAVTNGSRERAWYELPPGKSVSRKWPLGESLFPKPGEYKLVLRAGGVESATVTVTVTR